MSSVIFALSVCPSPLYASLAGGYRKSASNRLGSQPGPTHWSVIGGLAGRMTTSLDPSPTKGFKASIGNKQNEESRNDGQFCSLRFWQESRSLWSSCGIMIDLWGVGPMITIRLGLVGVPPCHRGSAVLHAETVGLGLGAYSGSALTMPAHRLPWKHRDTVAGLKPAPLRTVMPPNCEPRWASTVFLGQLIWA